MIYFGIVMIVFACIIGGWAFMCDSLPIPPRLSWSPIPLLIAIFIALGGIIFLFIVKWYWGLIGIGASVMGFNLFALIWHLIYKMFRL